MTDPVEAAKREMVVEILRDTTEATHITVEASTAAEARRLAMEELRRKPDDLHSWEPIELGKPFVGDDVFDAYTDEEIVDE